MLWYARRMAIYLIRHGETPLNAARIVQYPDTPLSERGRDQARRVGERLTGLGIGAVLIAPFRSTWDTRMARSTVVRWAMPLYALAVMAFGLSPNWPTGLLALFAVGGGFLAVISTTNTSVQMIVADEMRGRVMSVRVMGFTLSFPIGSLVQGALADWIGPRATVAGAGGLLLAAALALAARPATLITLDNETDTPDR